MAANGARKTPAPPSSKPGIVDPAVYKNIFPDHPKGKSLTIKLKKAAPKQTIPGNWKESEVVNVDSSKKSDAASTSPSSPLVNPQDEKTLSAFPTGRPLEDKVDTVQCRHCRRPVLRAVSANHIRECLNKKQEKLKKKKEAKEAKDAALRKEKGEKDDDAEGGKNNARKSAVKGAAADGDAAKKGKKRKLDGDAEKAPNAKKKKKDEPKAKAAKPKGPVDVEKQCGVALANGGFCARSLTCKSHSMGLKRAVPGRSLPYDMLLAQYQKKNQAKQQRAAIDANAPLAEDLEPQGAVDSDEEKEAVMAAIARARARPLATRTFIPTKSKYQFIRMKDMLSAALSGNRGASLFSTGQPPDPANMPPSRTLLGGLGMGGGGDSFSGSGVGGGGGQFAPPLSAGLDGPGSRRQSVMTGGNGQGPRQIMPGQLPPGAQRKASVASVASGA